MSDRSTPLQNLQNVQDQDNNTDLSTAQKVLQKYRELDNNTNMNQQQMPPMNQQQNPPTQMQQRIPNDGDADQERAALNQNMQERQMDETMAQQHRMMENQRMMQQQQMAQQQQMMRQQQMMNQQRQQPPPQASGLMGSIQGLVGNLRNNVKGPVIVIVLFILLSNKMVNNTLMKILPFTGTETGHVSCKGVLLKAGIAGLLFFILNTFIPL